LADVDRGPVYVPRLGLYLVKSGGPSLAEFQRTAAKPKPKAAPPAPESSHAAAMATTFGPNYQKLPAFPVPPYESAMRIDVPEPGIMGQWRLGAWHLKRWCRKVADDIWQVSIWRFRFREMWDMPHERKDYETTYKDAQPSVIGQESHEIIRALGILGGQDDVARGGLNWWIVKGDAKGNSYGTNFADFDGILMASNPGAGGPGYDLKHPTGHGLVMEAAAHHYRLTRDRAWFLKAVPRLKQACAWTLRQRLATNLPRNAWAYGLQPAINFGDYGGAAQFYLVNARFWGGLSDVATIMAELGVDGAQDLLRQTEEYRQDILAAVERSAALTPAVRMADGTYRRFVPATPNNRSNRCGSHDPLMGFLCLADRPDGVIAHDDPLVLDVLDVVEATFAPSQGVTMQVGYETHPRLHLLNDHVPLFLRSLYLEYAQLIRPWDMEPDTSPNRTTPATPVGKPAYEFFEHPGKMAVDKTFEEAVFLQRVRNLLAQEVGDTLWLARATPRAWLEQGKKIAVANAPTYFGTLGYEIVSDVAQQRITATVDLPARNPAAQVKLRLRHPQGTPIASVQVDGKEHRDFDKESGTIDLKGLRGKVTVVARY
jgi:hypothetical protein